jgi:hypothetical protein
MNSLRIASHLLGVNGGGFLSSFIHCINEQLVATYGLRRGGGVERKDQRTDNTLAERRKVSAGKHLGCLNNLVIFIEIDEVKWEDARHMGCSCQRLQPDARFGIEAKASNQEFQKFEGLKFAVGNRELGIEDGPTR